MNKAALAARRSDLADGVVRHRVAAPLALRTGDREKLAKLAASRAGEAGLARRARIVRSFQRLGYDEETLEVYDEALRDGELVLHVPARPADSARIAALLQRHQVHGVGYFGPGTFEQFPLLDTD
jgi:hypothetical protein